MFRCPILMLQDEIHACQQQADAFRQESHRVEIRGDAAILRLVVERQRLRPNPNIRSILHVIHF